MIPDPDQTTLLPEEVPPVERLPTPRRPPTLALPQDAGVDRWHHNFDLTTEDGKAALINASNVPDWIPSEGTTEVASIVHYVCFPDKYVDRETGEVVETTACVFVADDDKVFKFQNEWSLRRLNAMLTLYSPARWSQGVRMEFFSKPSRYKGRRYGSFRIVKDPQPKE
jgi:hypothetical protein